MAEQRQSLKGSFTDVIIQKILSGELKIGDKLKPERTLAEEYGISRGSVNQGILDLERMGFLRIVPRHGTYVADYLSGANPEALTSIMAYDSALIDPKLFSDFMALRTVVECECAYLSAGRIQKAEGEILEQLTDQIFASGEEELANNLFDYHMYVVRLSGNIAYTMLFCSFEKLIRKLIEAHYRNSSEELRKTLPYYLDLTKALIHGDKAGSQALMRKILDFGAEYLNKVLK